MASRPDPVPSTGVPGSPTRRVVVVGGGASGGMTAMQLLGRVAAGVEVLVIEPRETLGGGIAYSTSAPWHRINVPARTMGALPDDPDDFRRWTGAEPASFPPRGAWGAYLAARLAEAARGSTGSLRHLRTTAERLVDRDAGGRAGIDVRLAGGETIVADAVVLATGNALPPVPAWLAPVRDDPRVVVDAWAGGALDVVGDAERVAILGTGHTAVDVAETILRTRPRCHLVAVSRHGELPRVHEDPPRVRPSTPVFDVEAFRGFEDPLADGRARIATHPEGWRQGLDSLRPLHQALWLGMDDGLRRRFLDGRRTWEVHRSRLAAEVRRELDAWVEAGRLELRPFEVRSVAAADDGLRLTSTDGAVLLADRVVLATGPDERPGATPLLRAGIEDGLLRPGPLGLGIDADPATLRVLDASGSSGRPVHALGPILRGVLWETIAVPEIRAQAARSAEEIGAALRGDRRTAQHLPAD